MKWYQIYFLFLKLFVIIQFILILVKKESEDTILFLISDTLFKVSIGLFLILYFLLNKVPELDTFDRIIICFGGTLLLFDAIYINLPKILYILFKIDFNPMLIASDTASITWSFTQGSKK